MTRTRAKRVRTIEGIILALTLTLLLSIFSCVDRTYYREGVVDETKGLSVRIVDTTGKAWWCDDCYATKGDKVILKMDTNGTDEYIKDDIIKDINFVEE